MTDDNHKELMEDLRYIIEEMRFWKLMNSLEKQQKELEKQILLKAGTNNNMNTNS